MFEPLSTHQRIYGSSQGTTNNPHVLEERVMNNAEDSGVNEEDKYVSYLPLSPAWIHRVRLGTVRSFVARMPIFHREREKTSLLPLPHLPGLVVLQSRDPTFPRCPSTLQTAPTSPIPIRPRRLPRRKRPRPRLPPLKRYFLCQSTFTTNCERCLVHSLRRMHFLHSVNS